jgi:paraquat-inducible protein B
MPTVPTALEEASGTLRKLLADLQKLPLENIVKDLSAALRGVDQLVNSPALRTALDELPEAVNAFNTTLTNVNSVMVKLDGHVMPLARDVHGTLSQAQQALVKVERAAGAATTIIEPGSPLDHDLRQALSALAEAARAIQSLADSLERNPSAVLYGRPKAEGSAQ